MQSTWIHTIVAQKNIPQNIPQENKIQKSTIEQYRQYRQVLKNTADQQLAALAENKTKHAKIAKEYKANYPEIQKNQLIVDYFKRSWINNSNTTKKETIDMFFNENKDVIKENYQLAHTLISAQIYRNRIEQFLKIDFKFNAFNNPAIKMREWFEYKPIETQVGFVFYQYYKDDVTGNYILKRSGISKDDLPKHKYDEKIMDQYCTLHEKADQAIKYEIIERKDLLIKKIKSENDFLRKEKIPQVQNNVDSSMLSYTSKFLFTNFVPIVYTISYIAKFVVKALAEGKKG